MHIFIQIPQHEHLIVILNWLAPEELLGLLESAILLVDLVGLGIEGEAVWDPAVVTTEDQDLGVVKGEAAEGVSRGPVHLLVDDLDHLPLLRL